jgi:hypothetical protein
MNQRQLKTALVLLVVIALGAYAASALATEKGPPKGPPSTPPGHAKQGQVQGQGQSQDQNVTVNVGNGGGQPAAMNVGDTAFDASMDIGDTTVNQGDTTFNSENNSTNVVLVPNNNTESCLRVWGLSWGNSSGAGGIGIPHRSAPCDYEQAADDAAAIGDHDMAWFWRCHKKNVYKPFRVKGGTKEDAVQSCHAKMVQFLDQGTMQQRINKLEEQKAQLLEMRELDNANCKERTERCRGELMKVLGGDK